jgi:Rhodopirellula transposase DDE domain
VKRYPEAREIFITADAGGSNSYRSHVWKQQLQRVADKLGIAIHVSHFPPGTSKWNKVEHRLFSFISINWHRPLRTYETIINLIGNTTNRGGLVVRARLDRHNYPTGKKVSAKELRTLKMRETSSTAIGITSSSRATRCIDRLTSPFAGPKRCVNQTWRRWAQHRESDHASCSERSRHVVGSADGGRKVRCACVDGVQMDADRGGGVSHEDATDVRRGRRRAPRARDDPGARRRGRDRGA